MWLEAMECKPNLTGYKRYKTICIRLLKINYVDSITNYANE